MESMGRKPRPRRLFTPEFEAEIVELCQRGYRSIGHVARDFDLTETAVREWVKQAERDAGSRDDGGLTTAEREELNQLRRDNRRLAEDVAILQRATAFFAKRRPGESTRSSTATMNDPFAQSWQTRPWVGRSVKETEDQNQDWWRSTPVAANKPCQSP